MDIKKFTNFEDAMDAFLIEYHPDVLVEIAEMDIPMVPEKYDNELIDLILESDEVHLSLLKTIALKTIPIKTEGKKVFFKVVMGEGSHYIYKTKWFDENTGMMVEFVEIVCDADDLPTAKQNIKKWREWLWYIIQNHNKITGYWEAKLTGVELIERIEAMYNEMEKFLPNK